MSEIKTIFASGHAETVAAIKELLTKAEAGDLESAAIRVFKPDGTWEDVVMADTEEDKALALAAFRKMRESAN